LKAADNLHHLDILQTSVRGLLFIIFRYYRGTFSSDSYEFRWTSTGGSEYWMIYIQLFHCFRSLVLSGTGRIQKIHGCLKETNEKVLRSIYPHVRMMDAGSLAA
jgi:hypothetical protein